MTALNSPRILISRLSHIGDCILTLPMLSALRRAYPDAFIAWAVEKPSNQLIGDHPDLDEVILIPKSWMSRPANWWKLSKELRERQFDIAIDPQGITKSAFLSYLSRAKTRIGIRGKWGRELAPFLNNQLVNQAQSHLVDRSLELLKPFGISESRVDFRMQVDAQAAGEMQGFLTKNLFADRFVVINPGASWASKRWENERFGDLANWLYENHDLPTLVTWAGPEEHAMAVKVQGIAPSAVTLAPKTNLKELAAILSMSQFLIGCDTGPMHMATAVGTPCVGLYGPTLPEESGAYGNFNQHVQKWHQEGSCRERRGAQNLAMRDISVGDVQRACERMIEDLGVTEVAA